MRGCEGELGAASGDGFNKEERLRDIVAGVA